MTKTEGDYIKRIRIEARIETLRTERDFFKAIDMDAAADHCEQSALGWEGTLAALGPADQPAIADLIFEEVAMFAHSRGSWRPRELAEHLATYLGPYMVYPPAKPWCLCDPGIGPHDDDFPVVTPPAQATSIYQGGDA